MGGEPRVIDSDPWWTRLGEAVRRPAFMVGTAVVFFVLAILILIFVVLSGLAADSSDESSSYPIDYSEALVVSDERDLWALDLSTGDRKLLQRTSRGLAAFGVYERNTVYWREVGSPWVNSLSGSYANLTEAREWKPEALAVDQVTGKVYAVDGHAGKLSVFDAKSGNYGVAVTDLKDPVDVALDPSRGLMFIVQRSNSILKGNMDGTSVHKVISSKGVIAVAVDTQSPKLFWSEVEGAIFSSDYNGKNYKIVVISPTSTSSLGASGNRVFWSSPPNASNIRTLWNCRITIETGICSSGDASQIEFDDPKTLRVYESQPPEVENPCGVDNGGCHQLCLLKNTGTRHSCACYIGFQLKDDSKNCETVSEYILYIRGGFVRSRILDPDREAFTEARLPLGLRGRLELRSKPTVDFDYDYYTNTLAYSDDASITTLNLTSDEGGRVLKRDESYGVRSVAYDWLTSDLYYLADTKVVVGRSSLWMTLRKFDTTSNHLRSLALHPNTGVYFFSVLHERDSPKVYKMQGSKLSSFVPEYLSANETALAVDHSEDRVYWLSRDTTVIYHADLDGNDVQWLGVSVVREPRSISVHGRYVYVANLTSIWRLDKLTGRGAARMAPRFEEDDELIAGVRVFSRGVQEVKPGVPCVEDNGKCEQFCLRVPKRVVSGANAVEVTGELQKKCACEDRKTLSVTDGRSCL